MNDTEQYEGEKKKVAGYVLKLRILVPTLR